MSEEINELKHMHKMQMAAQQSEYETSIKIQQRLREEVRVGFSQIDRFGVSFLHLAPSPQTFHCSVVYCYVLASFFFSLAICKHVT